VKRCLLVGIDDYAFKPLSSAVNDALAVEAKLRALGLFAEAEIDLLLSPRDGTAVPARARPATSVAILDYLEALYRASKRLDRFLFYFAGHGISARRDPAHTKLCAALIPADVRAIGSDGRRLIDFDDLRARFRMRGPLEQFYIVDACRDLGWERNPDCIRRGLERGTR